MTASDYLNVLRGRGLLADIDVVFAQFIARNAAQDPALTLLAALVSNAASVQREIALPVARIGSREALAGYLRSLAPAEEKGDMRAFRESGPLPGPDLIGGLDCWPPDPGAFPHLFREYRPESDETFQPAPLVLANDLYYLGRAFQNELFLRDYLLSRTVAVPSAGSIPFETVTRLQLGDEQKSAVSAAAGSDFLVISGGPGTGKTTIVSVILALRDESPANIILCAPTGKAQMRMKQALDLQLENLCDKERCEELKQIQSSTIHRLLSWDRKAGTFRHNRKNPLRYRLFIVDECSMIPQWLMVALLQAVPEDAKVILLGDRCQLSSVEPGSVFGDFCGILRAMAPGSLAELNESRRFPQGGEICTMKDAINAGDAEKAWDYMAQPGREAVVSLGIPPKNKLGLFLREHIGDAWLSEKAAAVRYFDEDSIDGAWDRFEQFRILAPFNVGPYGADALNRHLRSIMGFPDTGSPVPGETFLIRKNDYSTNLFNGDTGILWFAGEDGRPLRRSEGGSRVLVFFPDPASGGGWRGIPLESLPPHDPAYAFTIHKSQGSDYDRVLMILPPFHDARGILARESVYTGLTRAKKHAVIAAEHDSFCDAVRLHINRVSGLPRLCGLPRQTVST